VITDDPVAVRLARSDRFRPVWHASPITILAVEPRDGAPPPASLVDSPVPLAAFLIDTRPEHVAVEVHAAQAAPVSVAVAWSPKWHGRLDGRALALRRTDDGLIAADIPAGDHKLRLSFRPDGWDRLGLTVTGGTILGVALRRRRRRPSAARHSFAGRGVRAPKAPPRLPGGPRGAEPPSAS
jgi:hypothetical protein